jgi:hypothetical protein
MGAGMSNYCNIQVGRLLEVRAASGYRTVAEVDAIFAAIGKQMAKVPASVRVVVVVDWRRCPLMSSEASEHALARITSNNPRTERSAALASRDSPVAMLQFLRLVRDSKNANRRLFEDPDELVEWLAELLTPPELERLHEFLWETADPHAVTGG